MNSTVTVTRTPRSKYSIQYNGLFGSVERYFETKRRATQWCMLIGRYELIRYIKRL